MQPASAAETMSHFHRVLFAAMDRNRSLFEDFTDALRQESVRFVNQRLDRSRQAMEALSECRGVPGLLGVQQSWVSELVQDCAEQGQRYSDLLSQSMNRIQEEAIDQADSVAEAAQPVVEEAQEMAQDVAESTDDMVENLPDGDNSYDPNYGQQHVH